MTKKDEMALLQTEYDELEKRCDDIDNSDYN